jgi:hypothetical protein
MEYTRQLLRELCRVIDTTSGEDELHVITYYQEHEGFVEN